MIESGQGELVIGRRPPVGSDYTASDYLPCQFCRGFYLRHLLWKHVVVCQLKPDGASTTNLTENGRGIIAPYVHSVIDTSAVDNLFESMKETKANPGLKEICEKDPLIRAYAQSRLDRLGSEQERRAKDVDLIRYRSRTLARLLKQLNNTTLSWKPLDAFIMAPKFDDILAATRALTMASDSPKLASNLGHYISQCAEQKKGLAIRAKDNEKRQDATDFLELFGVEWNNKITAVANRRQAMQHLNKPIIMPLTEDMVSLSQWLGKEIHSILAVPHPTSAQCKRLASLILVRILIFNKRRIAEVQELLVEDYNKRSKEDDIPEEMLNSLDICEKALAKRLVSFFLCQINMILESSDCLKNFSFCNNRNH